MRFRWSVTVGGVQVASGGLPALTTKPGQLDAVQVPCWEEFEAWQPSANSSEAHLLMSAWCGDREEAWEQWALDCDIKPQVPSTHF